MPAGPKGEKRHADVNRNALLIAKIATGDVTDDLPTRASEGKNPAAVALGFGKKAGPAAGRRTPQIKLDEESSGGARVGAALFARGARTNE